MRLVALMSPRCLEDGPFEAAVMPHPYLHGYPCGHHLYRGFTRTGVPILTCIPCKMIVDERRVD